MTTSDYTPDALSIQLSYLLSNGDLQLKEILRPFRLYTVYIVRNKNIVFYVGATSYDARSRLRSHIHDKTSRLGKYIKTHRDETRFWYVEIYRYKNRKDTFAAEKFFISTLCPILNKRDRS